MKTNIVCTQKLNNGAKKKFKELEKIFSNSIFTTQSGIIDFEEKILTNNFNVYKILLANFDRKNNNQSVCNINNTYAITDETDNVIFVAPNMYTHSSIKKQPISDISFLTPSINSVCEEKFTEKQKSEFLRLKEYITKMCEKNEKLEK